MTSFAIPTSPRCRLFPAIEVKWTSSYVHALILWSSCTPLWNWVALAWVVHWLYWSGSKGQHRQPWGTMTTKIRTSFSCCCLWFSYLACWARWGNPNVLLLLLDQKKRWRIKAEIYITFRGLIHDLVKSLVHSTRINGRQPGDNCDSRHYHFASWEFILPFFIYIPTDTGRISTPSWSVFCFWL